MASGIGSDGIVEIFLPPGGTAGQALVKIDTQNYNATWGAGGGGGGVGTISGAGGGATGPSVVFSNSNNVSFGVNVNTITATATFAQTNQSAGIYASSQTTGQSSSSTYDARSLSLVGDGIISVGWSNSSLRISATQSNQAMSAQGGSSAFQTLIFTNSNNVSFSNTGGSVWGSYALNVSATGGTSNALSGLTFRDSQGVSFGLSTGAGVGTITASVAAQTNQSAGIYASSQTFGQSSSSTHDARSLTVVGSGGISVGWSNSSLLISGQTTAAQTNQSAIKAFGASNTGNTAGNTGVSSGIDWVLAGSNNITISESTVGGGPNTLWVSGPSVGGAQTGISGIIVSDATYTSGTVSFSNAGNVTISSSVNGATQYIRLSGNPAQTNQSLGIYGSSQTYGQSSSSTYDARSLSIVGSGGVSVGWSNSSFLISGQTTVAQTNQSAIKAFGASNTGNTAGNTGVSTGIDWVIAGTNNITVSESTVGGGPNTLWLSGPTGGASPALSANNGSFSFQTASFSNVNNVSFVTAAGSAIQGSFALNVSATGGTSNALSGLTFKDSQGVSFGLSTGAGVGTITASVAAQSNQTGGIYVTAQSTGQSSSSTYDLRTLSIVPDGIISAGWSGGSFRISATQSNQAFSAAGGSSAFQTLGFSDNAAASFTNTNGSVAIASVRASLYATSNTTQSSTGTANLNSLIFAGAGIASVGVTNGSVVVSVPSGGGAGDGGVFAGVSTMGNTAGSTGTVSTGNFVFVGTGGVSLSQSTGAAGSAATMTISAPNSSLLSGSNGISLSTNGSTIYISAIQATNSWWQPEVYGNSLTTTFANNTVYFRPMALDGNYEVNNLMLQMSGSSTRTTASFSGSLHTSAAGVDAASSGTGQYSLLGTVLFFSRFNTNETHADFNKIQTFFTNTWSIGAGYSASVSWHMSSSSATVSVTTKGAVSYIANVDTAGNITTSATTSSNSTTFSSTSTNAQTISSSFILSFPYAHLSGFRPIYAPMSATSVSPGQYWVGLQVSSATARTNMTLESVAQLISAHVMVRTDTTNNFMEVGNSAAITSSNFRLGFGSHSNTSGTTTTMGLTAISLMNSNASVWLALNGNTR